MSREKLHEYRGKALSITYDVTRCIHSAACIRSVPRAFDPGSRPWVMPDNGTPDAVVRAVEACPTGALRYRRHDGGPEERVPGGNTVLVARNGPVYLRGDIKLTDSEGGVTSETRLALCRCGASTHKPLCDGSHSRARFHDAGIVPANTGVRAGTEASGPVTAEPQAGGPVLIRGAFQLIDATGAVAGVLPDAALCRCGRSGNKPFCDGSHMTP